MPKLHYDIAHLYPSTNVPIIVSPKSGDTIDHAWSSSGSVYMSTEIFLFINFLHFKFQRYRLDKVLSFEVTTARPKIKLRSHNDIADFHQN